MKALRRLWIALRAAVLATAVFGIVLFAIDNTGWKGLSLSGVDLTEYVVFFAIFVLGMLMAGK